MVMNAVVALAGAFLVGVVVYLCCSRKLAAAKAELNAKEDVLAKERQDGAADLERQAQQYREQLAALNNSIEALQDKLDAAREEVSSLKALQARNDTELKVEREKVAELRRQYEETLQKAEARFKTLAQTILEERCAKLRDEGEKGMQGIADGLRQCIQEFRQRVEKINGESAERSGKLGERISVLVDQTNAVSDQANKLAQAIRGEAQVTGEWGEHQLKRVLELGGLQETVDYSYQETFAESGSTRVNLRTDVLIKMSDGRWMVIDAKTTLPAYVDYVAAEGDENRQEPRQRIISSLQKHVEEMKTAAYHRKLEQVTGKKLLNTMLMYIPFEEVYLIAMKAEISVGGTKKTLREYALENDVVFINSTGLLPVVKMLADFWAVAKADRKAMKIKEAAEAMAEKFRVFLEADDGFMKLGNQLAGAVKCYNESVKRLAAGQGNVVRKISDLRDMGVAVPALPPAEEVEGKLVGLEVATTTAEGGRNILSTEIAKGK